MKCVCIILALIGALAGGVCQASFQTWSGLEDEHSQWLAASGGGIPSCDFESYTDQVCYMPGIHAYFSDDVSPCVNGGSRCGGNQIVNFGPGRPAWSTWTIKPEPGRYIQSLGLWSSGGYSDTVDVRAYDAEGNLVGSVATPIITGADFAGFLSSTPIYKVVVVPLGNYDGLNGFDDLQIGTVALPGPSAVVGINSKSAHEPIVAQSAGSFQFKVWGRATLVTNYSFSLDDGSGMPVTVVAPGFPTIQNGDYLSAVGTPSTSSGSALISAKGTDVLKLN